jgi:cellulose 1,4-beta-cellobiosidase
MVGGDHTALGTLLARAASVPTAIWLDSIAALPKMREALEDADERGHRTGKPTLCVFVVYNLPGRDCSARASAGELPVGASGLTRYQHDFLAPIAQLAREFPEVPIAFVLEPDSLPNLATNMYRPNCQAAASGYRSGISLAVKLLGQHGATYLDAGWSGWVGTWSGAVQSMADELAKVLQLAGDEAQHVRGFATNVANYGELSAEVAYALALRGALASAGSWNLAFIIDSGRNGGATNDGKLTWCNLKGAGLGEPPTAYPKIPFADALFWIKPPGESDGVSSSSATRFDSSCGSYTSLRGAPEAGEWFHEQFVELVQKASPPLSNSDSYRKVDFVFARPPRPPTPPRSPLSPPPGTSRHRQPPPARMPTGPPAVSESADSVHTVHEDDPTHAPGAPTYRYPDLHPMQNSPPSHPSAQLHLESHARPPTQSQIHTLAAQVRYPPSQPWPLSRASRTPEAASSSHQSIAFSITERVSLLSFTLVLTVAFLFSARGRGLLQQRLASCNIRVWGSPLTPLSRKRPARYSHLKRAAVCCGTDECCGANVASVGDNHTCVTSSSATSDALVVDG